MNQLQNPSSPVSNDPINRFIGFDISKRSCVVAAVDAKQQVLLQPKKITIEKLEGWISQNLLPTDQVVLEASFNTWFYYDCLKPLVAKVSVANPCEVKLITRSKVKTDARDALALAKLLAADLVPTVWIPPTPVRELRALVGHRQGLVTQRSQTRTRLQGILATQHILPPGGEPFSAKNEQWWQDLKLSASSKLMVSNHLAHLRTLNSLILKVEQELVELSASSDWAKQSAFLIQLPGIGVVTAMTILSAIGDISRFPSAKKLVGYSGLGSSIYASGQVVRTGPITKEGRPELRAALVEASWTAVGHDEFWKEIYTRLANRIGRGKAIVAIARKLLVIIWQVLSKQEADRQAKDEKVASKIMRWGYKLRARGRKNLSGPDFTRLQLTVLGLGVRLHTFEFEGRKIILPLEAATIANSA